MSDNNLIVWEGYTVKEMAEMIVRQQEAIADARAAGYAEAIEKAAQVALDIECEEGAAFVCGDASGVVKRSLYDAIRALAPAATPEGPK